MGGMGRPTSWLVDNPCNRCRDTNTDVSLLLKRFSCDEHRRRDDSDRVSLSAENRSGDLARENTSMRGKYVAVVTDGKASRSWEDVASR
jgi:hypothetical protein